MQVAAQELRAERITGALPEMTVYCMAITRDMLRGVTAGCPDPRPLTFLDSHARNADPAMCPIGRLGESIGMHDLVSPLPRTPGRAVSRVVGAPGRAAPLSDAAGAAWQPSRPCATQPSRGIVQGMLRIAGVGRHPGRQGQAPAPGRANNVRTATGGDAVTRHVVGHVPRQWVLWPAAPAPCHAASDRRAQGGRRGARQPGVRRCEAALRSGSGDDRWCRRSCILTSAISLTKRRAARMLSRRGWPACCSRAAARATSSALRLQVEAKRSGYLLLLRLGRRAQAPVCGHEPQEEGHAPAEERMRGAQKRVQVLDAGADERVCLAAAEVPQQGWALFDRPTRSCRNL